MANNNNENIFLSGLTIDENQSFVSEQLKEDYMMADIKHTSQKDNKNSKSCILDQSKDPDMEVKTIQAKKKRKQWKKEKKLQVDISESYSSDHRLKN